MTPSEIADWLDKRAWPAFSVDLAVDIQAATTISELIAENDQLNVDLVEWEIDYRTAKSERDLAVALLRKAKAYVSIASHKDSDMAYNPARDQREAIKSFLARIDKENA